jgi:putative transposon-encoded protein
MSVGVKAAYGAEGAVYSLRCTWDVVNKSRTRTVYEHSPVWIRKRAITQIESIVTPSGNSGHVVVPKAWIGKEAIVTLKEMIRKRSKR